MEALNLMGYSDNNGVKVYSAKDVYEREDHAELISNSLVVTDKTTVAHNNAVLEIATALRSFISSKKGKCRVFTENIALYCDELCDASGNLFLPDIMVVCNEDGIKDDGVHCAPKFVAEVTSEATRKNDYGKKLAVYGEIGVEEYWIADLQKNRVVRYLSEDDFAPEIITYPHTSTMSMHTYPDLEIDLTSVF